MISERSVQAVNSSLLPHHQEADGSVGEDMQLPEWLESQMSVAAVAAFGLLRAPRHEDGSLQDVCIPAIPDDLADTAFHLLEVHKKGMLHVPESFKTAKENVDVDMIMEEWAAHFGPLFNIMAKQYQVSYERVASLIYSFQMRLVEHTQHLRRIWEQHKEGPHDPLPVGTAWQMMDWSDPVVLHEEGVEYLRQSVFLPHVVGFREHTKLLLNDKYHTRESMMALLSPCGVYVVEKKN